METIKREPVRLGAAIMALVSAVLVLLVAFGVEITDAQQQAIIGVVGAVITMSTILGVGEWMRSKVTPTAAPRMEDGQPAIIVPATYWGSLVQRAHEAEKRK